MPSSHLRKVFDPVSLRKIAAAVEHKRKKLRADIVVARGLSGVIVATAMGTLFDTPFAIVRKSNEMSHGRSIEVVDNENSDNGCWTQKCYKDWIIVDDLVASGATVEAILDAIRSQRSTFTGVCRGIVLYNEDEAEQRTNVFNGELHDIYHIGSI